MQHFNKLHVLKAAEWGCSDKTNNIVSNPGSTSWDTCFTWLIFNQLQFWHCVSVGSVGVWEVGKVLTGA